MGKMKNYAIRCACVVTGFMRFRPRLSPRGFSPLR
jgi:hypothetical protein